MTIPQRLPRSLLKHTSITSRSLPRPKSFSTTPSFQAKNRIYDNIRSQTELDNHILLSASSRTALITLWTTSTCPSCKLILPLLLDLIAHRGAGEEAGGVSFAEVEFDSPTLASGTDNTAARYAIRSIPTLMAFSRSEPQMETRLTDVNEMRDEEFLALWISSEARRGRAGGGGAIGNIGHLFGIR